MKENKKRLYKKFITEVYIVFSLFLEKYFDDFFSPINEDDVRKKSKFIDCHFEQFKGTGKTTLNFRYFLLRISRKKTIDNISFFKDMEIHIEVTRYNTNPDILNILKDLGQENGFRVIPTSKEKIIYINFIDEKWSI